MSKRTRVYEGDDVDVVEQQRRVGNTLKWVQSMGTSFNDELCYAKQLLEIIQGRCFNDTSN